jgi:hypothetical protein
MTCLPSTSVDDAQAQRWSFTMVIRNWLVNLFQRTHTHGFQRLSGRGGVARKRRRKTQLHQPAAMIETLETRQMLTGVDFWSTSDGQAILAALSAAQANYQAAVGAAGQVQTTADQGVTTTY